MASEQAAPIVRYLRKIVPDPQSDRQSDRQLLQQFLSRQDEAAFAALVRRHGNMVLAVCQSILHHEQDAQDASQATFLVLARKAGSIRKQESVGSWLHGVAYHLALKVRQGNRRCRGDRESGMEQRNRGGRGVTRNAFLRDSPRTPRFLDDLTWRELREALHQELNRLPEKNRLPLILCYLEGKTQEEAARQLGWTAATLKGRLDRGRNLLRKRLTRRGLTLSVPLLAAALSRDVAMASSPAWLKATAQAAVLFARGEPAAGLSTQAAAWAQGALKAMAVGKLKVGAALILAFGLLAAGTGVAVYQLPATEGAKATQEKSEAKAKDPGEQRQQRLSPARLDQFGDPLPAEAIARIGTVRFRHGGFVHFLRFSPDGETLVSYGNDGARIWQVASGKQIRFVPVEDHHVRAVSLTADGKLLATSGESGILLQAVDSGREVRRLGTGHYSVLAFSPDAKVLAAQGDNPNRLELWDVSNARRLQVLNAPDQPFSYLAFTDGGKSLLAGGSPYLRFPVHPKNTVHLWDVATGRERSHFEVGAGNVRFPVLSPDASLLALEFWNDNAKGPDNRIAIWDVTARKMVREIVGMAKEVPPAGQLYFSALAFAPHGKTLIAGGIDDLLIAYDVATGAELRRFGLGIPNPQALTFTADGKTLAVAMPTATIRLIDMATGKDRIPDDSPQMEIHRLALASDGRTVITAEFGTIVLWDAATGRVRRRLQSHLHYVQAVRMAGDGHTLVTLEWDRSYQKRELQVWEVATGKELHRIPLKESGAFGALAVAPDGKSAALAAAGGDIIALDLTTGKEQRRFKGPTEFIYGAAFASDGCALIVWSGDSFIYRWDVATGQELIKFSVRDAEGQPVPGAPAPLPAGRRSGLVYTAEVSPDGRWIAIGTQTKSLTIYELATGRLLRRVEDPPDGTLALAFSPDGRTLAYGEQHRPDVHLIELATGRKRHRFSGQRGGITSLAFFADGKRLVSGSADTTALIWDLSGNLAAKAHPITPELLETCWTNLAGDDAARGYQAIRRLVASPSEAIPYLREHLKLVPAVDQKRVVGLIADLDSNQFAVRESAEKELEKLGEIAGPACRKALEQKPTAEVRRRLEALLEKQSQEWQNPSSERLRTLRAIEVLEHMATAEAKQVLSSLTKGAPEARLTQEAKASLERLSKR
jgi:RNA polymerase sigma factor (sigma-70 family)